MIDAIILWQSESFFALSLLSVLLTVCSLKKNYSLAALWSFALVSALYIAFRPFDSPITGPQMYDKFCASAGQTYALLLIVPLFFLLLPKQYFELTRKAFLGVGLLNSALVWIYGSGLMGANTFDAAFLAMMIPMTHYGPVALIFLITAVKTKSLTALTVIGAQCLVYFSSKFKKKRFQLVMPILTVSGWAAYLFLNGKNFASATNRMTHWRALYRWWEMNANPWFGTGFGTFYWLSPDISQVDGRLLLFGHNDWFQLMFEGGLIGLSGAVAVFLMLFKNGSNGNRVMLAGMATCMLTYHPTHFLFSSCLCAFIVRKVLDGNNATR